MREPNDETATLAFNTPFLRVSGHQLDTYYRLIFNTCLGSMAGATFLVFILWTHVSSFWIVSWLVAIFTLNLMRLGFAYMYAKAPITSEQLPSWTYIALWLTAFAGLAWGLAGLFLAASLPATTQFACVLLFCIVAIASIPAHGVNRVFYFFSSVSILGPAILVLMLEHGGASVIYASLLCIICIALNIVANYYRESLETSEQITPGFLERHQVLQQSFHSLNAQLEEKVREEELASKVFGRIIKTAPQPVHGVSALIRPISDFSGDYLFWQEGPKGELSLIIADFTGHGMPAAMCAIPVASTFSAMAKKGLDVETIVKELNAKLVARLATEQFCCALILQFSPDRTECQVWNGGIPDAFILDQQGAVKARLKSTHLPLGISNRLDDQHCELHAIEPGETVFAYTDGVIEAQNLSRQNFGVERLLTSLTTHYDQLRPLETIVSQVEKHAHGADQHDDIAMLMVKT